MKTARIRRVRVINDRDLTKGVVITCKSENGGTFEATVTDPHDAAACMAFDFDRVRIGDDGAVTLLEKADRKQGVSSMMHFTKAATNASQRLYPARHGGEPGSPNAKQPAAVISAQALAAAVYHSMKQKIKDMDPESAAQVLEAATQTAAAALRQAGITVTFHDPDNDASMNPQAAQAAGDAAGKQTPAAKGMTTAELRFFKSLGMPGLTSIEKALSIGSDLQKARRRHQRGSDGRHLENPDGAAESGAAISAGLER